MAEEMDRTKRYANPPKGKKNGMQYKEESGAESKAKSTAGSPPDMADADRVAKAGEDPGPEGGHDATWGVVAERHKREHGEMLKRHMADHVGHHEAHKALVERHHKEHKEMHSRHHEEMQDAMEGGAEGEAERSAGSPKILGRTESEGRKGAEV